MEQHYRILVVDDDQDVRELLKDYLTDNGFLVDEADCANALRTTLQNTTPDIILLDVGLPGEDGLSLARFLREHHDLPVIIVSGAGQTVDRIIGLEVGADDYIAKPFDPRELLARIKSVLRRYQRPAINEHQEPDQGSIAGGIRCGRCLLDLDSRQLFDHDGSPIALTAMEFDLLQAFVQRPNRPLSRDQLLNLTQKREWDPYDRSIDIRIARLRKKIEENPEKPQTIKTIRGMGYMFVPGKPANP